MSSAIYRKLSDNKENVLALACFGRTYSFSIADNSTDGHETLLTSRKCSFRVSAE